MIDGSRDSQPDLLEAEMILCKVFMVECSALEAAVNKWLREKGPVKEITHMTQSIASGGSSYSYPIILTILYKVE